MKHILILIILCLPILAAGGGCGTLTVKTDDNKRLSQTEKGVTANRKMIIIILRELNNIHKTLRRIYQPTI